MERRCFPAVLTPACLKASLLLMAVTAVIMACSKSDDEAVVRAQLASTCAINTDCADPLVCTFKKCHTQCNVSSDCPPGTRCVTSATSTGDPVNVCQLPEEANCSRNSQCPLKQVCAIDNQCRDGCTSARDCKTGQECRSGACAEVAEPPLVIDAAVIGTTCTLSSQCPGTLVCRNGVCAPECKTARDCSGGACTDGRCITAGSAAPCSLSSDCPSDQVCKNGRCGRECEAEKDCWPPRCDANGCAQFTCNLTSFRCIHPCKNGIKDGTETDIDCGGSCPRHCPTGKTCTVNGDCVSNACLGTVCGPGMATEL